LKLGHKYFIFLSTNVKIFGPIHCKKGWIIRNNEMQDFIKGTDIIKCIEAPRIKCCGLYIRMEDIKLVKEITDWNPIRIRPEGRTDK
jgi:hypothetical protein